MTKFRKHGRPLMIEALEYRTMLSVGTLLGATQNVGNAVGPDVADPVRDVAYFYDQGTSKIVAVNTDTGQTVGYVKTAANVAGLAVSVDDTRLYASEPGAFQIEVFSLPTMTLAKTLSVGVAVQQILAISNDRLIGDIGSIEGFNAETGASLFDMPGDFDGLLRTNAAGTMLYSRARSLSGNDGGIRVWDISGATPAAVASIPGPVGANSTDFAVDAGLGKAYLEDGGVNGIEVTQIGAGSMTTWGFVNGGGPGNSVAELPGGPFVYATTFFGNVEQFNQSGVATATLAIPDANAQSLVITPNGNLIYTSGDTVGIVGISTLNITEIPHLVFAVQPSNTLVGNTITPAVVVNIENPQGDVVSGDDSTVTLSLASGSGILGGTLSVSAINGVATFGDLSLNAAAMDTLGAADGSDASAVSNPFQVSLPHLVFVQQPSAAMGGTAITPAVSVAIEDGGGNILTSDDSDVTVSLNSGTGALAGTLTVQAQNGVATFSDLSVNLAGMDTLLATDGSDTSTVSNPFNIAVPQLVFMQPPGASSAGVAISPAVTVAIEDGNGNILSADDSTVTLSADSGPGRLTGTLSAQAQNGIATFSNLILNTPGSYTIEALDGNDSPALSGLFNVNPVVGVPLDDATKLAIVQQPTSVLVNGTIGPAVVVHVEDRHGNVVTSDSSAVTISINRGPGEATLGGTLTVNAVSGVATFSDLSVDSEGAYTLAVSDGGLRRIVSARFLAGGRLAWGVEPADAIAGANISPGFTVDVDDANGNPILNDHSRVVLNLSSSPTGGRMFGSRVVVAQGGVATFSAVNFHKVGSYTFKAISGRLTPVFSSSFNVTAAAASKMVFSMQPASTTSTAPFQVDVELFDRFGNVATNDSSSVSLSLARSPAGAILSGTTTITVTSGVATFSGLSLDLTGAYAFSATDTPLRTVKSRLFRIS